MNICQNCNCSNEVKPDSDLLKIICEVQECKQHCDLVRGITLIMSDPQSIQCVLLSFYEEGEQVKLHSAT